MTVVEFGNKTSQLIAKYPQHGDFLAIATFDAFDEIDESPMLDELMTWCLNLCKENIVENNIIASTSKPQAYE